VDVKDVAAFILAGGRSTRMGRDKSLLHLRGRTLLERALEAPRSVTGRIRIVGPKAKFGPDAIEDLFADRGPLGGIHAALAQSTAEINLVLSVDMPFVATEFLQLLAEESRRTGAVVTVPFIAEQWQPLCAAYRREFAGLAERALQAGKNKIDPLFCHTTVRRLDDEELKRLAFDARMFDNLNTPEDLARAQERE
jgi:molybdopterin-guanine dinucleotide biosynthesis protein A